MFDALYELSELLARVGSPIFVHDACVNDCCRVNFFNKLTDLRDSAIGISRWNLNFEGNLTVKFYI